MRVFTYFNTLHVFLLLLSASVDMAAGSCSSGSGSGYESSDNTTIDGCPTATVQAETQQSPDIIQLSLPVSFTDPIEITSNVISSVPLSYMNIMKEGENALVLSFPGGELSLETREVVFKFNLTITDNFGAEINCILTFEICIIQASVCGMIDETAVIPAQISFFLASVDITILISISQSTSEVESRIRATIADLMNVACFNNCSMCRMTSECRVFLQFCLPFNSSNIWLLNIISTTTTNMKRQVTMTTYTVAVTNPTQNSIIPSFLLPSEILQEVLSDNQEQFFNGTGLMILSVVDNNPSEELTVNLKLLATIVLPVVVVVLVAVLIAGITTILVVNAIYKYKKKSQVLPDFAKGSILVVKDL